MVSHQTILPPMVTLHSAEHQHQLHQEQQLRPDSPSSLEDLSSENCCTDSGDYPDTTTITMHQQLAFDGSSPINNISNNNNNARVFENQKIFDTADLNIKFIINRGAGAGAGAGATGAISTTKTTGGDLGLLSSETDSTISTPSIPLPTNSMVRKPNSALVFPETIQKRNNYHQTDLMMATPPLSPTGRQFEKEDYLVDEVDHQQQQGTMGTSTTTAATPPLDNNTNNNKKHEEKEKKKKKNSPSPARARAGSAPPATTGGQYPITSDTDIPPVPPVPRIPGGGGHHHQSINSAWASLLPGVAPIRVNPKPAVKTTTRSNNNNSLEHQQRVPQQVPIMLPHECEVRLTMEMYSLFETLLPTEESHQRRTMLISKIERIIRSEWPGQDIKVLPFGSTVNDLGTNSSDVDVCILTSWLGLRGVEMLADVFRKHGMENLFCVPEAKVPIVKLWDPELQLSCDMNINTQLGIMNSRMVKTYVAIDPRVRPFAMIIKHWAKKRVLNDAANGGTISTYTWICMVINFLQMRSPPILPSLHDMDHELSPDNQVINGNNTSFFSDLSVLEGFGRANKESLGGLLYAFFRKFAIEFDYDRHVVSVRHGCYLTKESKEWHIPGKHYRLLCIEEPFDTTRNLGNSCDMASSKGLKQEFRRALDILNHGGSLDQICEQWVFPPYYYHNNSNNKSGSNSSFLTNNQAAGRRYGNGYRPQRHGPNPRSGGDSNRTDDSVKQIDSSRHSRASNNFHQANGRNERAGYDRRSRSSSATYLRDSGSTLNANHGADSFKDTRRGSDTKGYKDSSVNGSSNTEDSIAVEVPLQDRPRKSSVHGRDDSPKPILSHETQSLRTASSKTSPSSLSPTRSKPSNSKGGDGYKSHGGQKNNRSNGTNRDNRYGGKVPNATVELCLADIAKIVKKTDLPQLLSNSVETKKAAGKGSVIWSTNSNRGGSRGGGHSSARSQNSGAGGQTRSRSMVSSHGELEEAGPRFEITGSS